MMEQLLSILAPWVELARKMPWRTSLVGMAIAMVLLGYLAALSRARFEMRSIRVSTGPLFALSGMLVLGLSIFVAIIDAILEHYHSLLIEERILLLLAPGEGQEAYEFLRRLFAFAQGGRFVLPGPVHLPLALFLFGALYLGLVWWAARTLEELASLEQKPDDVIAKERAEQEKAIKKALAEGRAIPTTPVETVPLADDLFGRVYKLLGHWTSVEFVEARFLRWQRPLLWGLLALAASALPGALAGHFSAPLWAGCALAIDGLRRNLSTRTKGPDKPEEKPAKEEKAPRPALRPLVEAVHQASGPLFLPPEIPSLAPAQISPGTDLKAKRLLEDLLPELGAQKGLYVHQGLACDAFSARKNVLLSTPPLSGKTTTLDLLVFYALLVEAENVLWLAPDPALAREAERRVLGRASVLRWKWNVHAANIAVGAGAVDPKHALPSLVFSDPEGAFRELCGRQEEWSSFLGGLGLIVLPSLDAWHGPRGAHLALLLRRLQRAASRAAPASPRAKERGERIRFVATAEPSFRDLGQFAERVVGRPFHVLGPEVSGAPRPPLVAYFLPSERNADQPFHPAVRVLGEALAFGFAAELFGYEDVLSLADVAKANEVTLGRGVATRGRAFGGERAEVVRSLGEAEVIVARVSASRYGKTAMLASHFGFRAATVPEARLVKLGAGERVGKAMTPPVRKEEEKPAEEAETEQTSGEVSAEAIAQADLERKVLVFWQPDADPLSALLARERPPFDHPDLRLGMALVADPLAEGIQRAHLRAALAEAEWTEEELFSDFSRPIVLAELNHLSGNTNAADASSQAPELAEGVHLVRRSKVVVDPDSGERREVSLVSMPVRGASSGLLFDVAAEPARVIDRPTSEVLFGVERARMLSAAYPGRIFVFKGGRYVVKPLEEQDGLEAFRVAAEREERALSTSVIRQTSLRPIERRIERRIHEREAALPSEGQERRVEPVRSMGGASFLFERRLVEVEETVLGVRRHHADGSLADVSLYAEPIVYRYATKATFFALPPSEHGEVPAGVLHALGHLFRVTLKAFVYHEEEDILITRVSGFGASSASGIAFVDAHPLGAGFSEAITLDVLRMLVGWSLAILERCPAQCNASAGCRSCLQVTTCHAPPGQEGDLDKRGAIALMKKLLGSKAMG